MDDHATISFTKFSATGNDFILIDNREFGLSETDREFFVKICKRRISVGADGVLLIDNSKEFDFSVRYFNADGSEAQCGNGARCAAFFAFQKGICDKKNRFNFLNHIYDGEVDGNTVIIKMPEPKELFKIKNVLQEKFLEEGGFVDTGVPHYVLFGTDVENIDVAKIGKKYRYHPDFRPDATNVNFVEILSKDAINVRTYERGVEAETLSCGTGCVASAYLAHLRKNVQFPIQVRTAGGYLQVQQDQKRGHFYLSGQVKAIYEGRLQDFASQNDLSAE